MMEQTNLLGDLCAKHGCITLTMENFQHFALTHYTYDAQDQENA